MEKLFVFNPIGGGLIQNLYARDSEHAFKILARRLKWPLDSVRDNYVLGKANPLLDYSNIREKKKRRKKSSNAALKIVASGSTYLLVYPNAQPIRTTKDKAQVYFKRMRVLKKYYSSRFKGKVYHLGR